jgi:hypothetical protein
MNGCSARFAVKHARHRMRDANPNNSGQKLSRISGTEDMYSLRKMAEW